MSTSIIQVMLLRGTLKTCDYHTPLSKFRMLAGKDLTKMLVKGSSRDWSKIGQILLKHWPQVDTGTKARRAHFFAQESSSISVETN